jgi:hypothetical protein
MASLHAPTPSRSNEKGPAAPFHAQPAQRVAVVLPCGPLTGQILHPAFGETSSEQGS